MNTHEEAIKALVDSDFGSVTGSVFDAPGGSSQVERVSLTAANLDRWTDSLRARGVDVIEEMPEITAELLRSGASR